MIVFHILKFSNEEPLQCNVTKFTFGLHGLYAQDNVERVPKTIKEFGQSDKALIFCQIEILLPIHLLDDDH